jgi:hypothetical protein
VAPNSGVTVTIGADGSTKYFNAAGQDITATLKTAGGGFTDFVNKNATMLGIAAAAFLGLMVISRR